MILRSASRGPIVEPEDGEILDEEMRQEDRNLGTSRAAASHKPTVARHACHRRLPSRRSDVLEHNIDSTLLRVILDCATPFGITMVDNELRAEFATQIALRFRAAVAMTRAP